MGNVVTFGTFDLFHIGHVRLLERAASFGALHVGVSTDTLNWKKKGRLPVYNQYERLSIVSAMRNVAGVFYEESLEKKRQYLMELNAHVLVMGDDWTGKFDYLADICKVVYLPRTPEISTSETISSIAVGAGAHSQISANSRPSI